MTNMPMEIPTPEGQVVMAGSVNDAYISGNDAGNYLAIETDIDTFIFHVQNTPTAIQICRTAELAAESDSE